MPYLDLDAVAASIPALVGVGMAEKRAALAGLVREVLQAHDARFAVEERIRQATLDGSHRADRVAIMGDPARYAEVTHAQTRLQSPTVGGGAGQVAHEFRVRVWVGYRDEGDYGDSSQALFDGVAESLEAATPGLAHVLTQQPVVVVDGEPVTLGTPDRIDVPELVALSRSARDTEYAHFFSLTITLT